MTDLEDRILKKNIPGKYSWWDDYNDDDDNNDRRQKDEKNDDESCDSSGNSTSDLVEQVRKWDTSEHHSLPKPLQLTALAGKQQQQQQQQRHNTGVKGVLSDYRVAQKEEYDHQLAEEQDRNAILHRAVYGATLKPGEIPLSAAAVAERMRMRMERSNQIRDEEDEEENDEDDEFLAQYRQKRLFQLQHTFNWPSFGEIKEVDPIQYAEIVDSTDPRVMVIVHLYEPVVDQCNVLNQLLEKLARSMPYARFLRLRAFHAKKNFDPIGLPAMMIYKDSKMVQNWTRVIDYLPKIFGMEDVQELLESVGVVNPYSAEAVVDKTGSENRFGSGLTTTTIHQLEVGKNTGSSFDKFRRYDEENEYDSDDAELDEFCEDFVPSG